MTTLIDARPHEVAVKAALTAKLGATANVYDYGKVPGADGNTGVLPDAYVLLTVERRFNPLKKSSGSRGSVGWRITARCAGKTTNDARTVMFKVAQALDDVKLSIASKQTTAIEFESEQNPELDNGRQSGLSLWTYAH